MARDRPSPYGDANPFWPVARGPVPRDGSRENISSGPTDLRETVVRDRLLPNGQDQASLPYREDARTHARWLGEGLGAPPGTARLSQFNRSACRHRFKGGINDAHLIDAALWRDTVRFPCG